MNHRAGDYVTKFGNSSGQCKVNPNEWGRCTNDMKSLNYFQDFGR